MKTTLATLVTAALFSLSLGCSASDAADPAMATSQTLSGGVETAVWKAVPAKKNAELVVHAEHSYAGDLVARCGPGYSVDLVVDFGTVSSDTLGIDAVTAFYLPHAGSGVVALRLGTWTKPGAASDVAIDSAEKHPGEHVRYQVKREYRLDPDEPIVVVELETAGALAPRDPACRQVARFVFYPVIPR